MQRHTYHHGRRLRVVLLSALLPLPLTALAAGYSTNAWPAWSAPREGLVRYSDLRGAYNERVVGIRHARTGEIADAPGWSYSPVWPYPPTYPRGPYHWFTNFKAQVATKLLPHYLDLAVLGNPPTYSNLTAWLDLATTNVAAPPSALPAWTATGVCAFVRLPTNLFDWTEPRGLHGLGTGGATNDNYAGVGHPYGETNQWTVAGGTNFPAGRDQWYSTDYGYDSVRAVLDVCTHLQHAYSHTWHPGDSMTNINAWSGSTYPSAYYTWLAAQAVAEAAYATNHYYAEALAPGLFYRGHYNPGGTNHYGADVSAIWSRRRLYLASTGAAFRVVTLLFTDGDDDSGWVGGGHWLFDPNGQPVASNAWTFVECSQEHSRTNSGYVWTDPIGPLTNTLPGAPPDPYTLSGGGSNVVVVGRGWSLVENPPLDRHSIALNVVDFSVPTNGFLYRGTD